MTHRNNSGDDCEIVSPDRVRLTVQGILRGAQASGWTDDSLAAASGVRASTIKGYRVEGKEPSLSKALSLAVVIGGNAINPLLALIGYAARPLEEAGSISPMRMTAKAMQSLSVIANAAADDVIDHIEAPSCRRAADELIATILPISSHGDAA